MRYTFYLLQPVIWDDSSHCLRLNGMCIDKSLSLNLSIFFRYKYRNYHHAWTFVNEQVLQRTSWGSRYCDEHSHKAAMLPQESLGSDVEYAALWRCREIESISLAPIRLVSSRKRRDAFVILLTD